MKLAMAMALAVATLTASWSAQGQAPDAPVSAAAEATDAPPATTATVAAGGAAQRELLKQAQLAERESRPAVAAELYRSALDAAPSSRLARRARARLGWLQARSEGDFAPLKALMAARQGGAADDRSALEVFEAQLATFPQGRVRRESLAFVAGTYLHRLNDPVRALRAYQAWADSPDLAEGERQLATSGVALAASRLGQADPARMLSDAGLGHRAEAVYLRAQRIGRWGSWLAWLLVGGFVAAALAAGGWRGLRPAELRRALSPARLAIAGYTLLVPLALLWLYDRRMAPQLAAVVGACALVLLLASVLGAGVAQTERGPRSKRVLAVLAALATLGAAFVATVRSRLLFDIMLSMEAG